MVMVQETIYHRSNTSKQAPGYRVYHHLLRKLVITRPDQVRASDPISISMARGFVYLCTVIDRFSHNVLSWWLSITMEANFCIEAVEEALPRYGKSNISTQAGIAAHLDQLHRRAEKAQIAVPMDARGAWRDNAFVERL